jgi:hypothetical protein
MSKGAFEVFMTACVIFLIIAACLLATQRDDLKAEAVKRGFAEWVSDYNGNTTFKWKEETK